MKIYDHKNGYVTVDSNPVNGFYTITLKTNSGKIYDRVSCDNKLDAKYYILSFRKIAKNLAA